VAPGRRTWPYHYHLANEEAIYVLEGSGKLRTADGEIELEAGDYVAFPPGEAGGHQLTNPSRSVPLRYLCFSNMQEPDVTVYPGSRKVGIFAGAAPGEDRKQRTLNKYLGLDAEVDYGVRGHEKRPPVRDRGPYPSECYAGIWSSSTSASNIGEVDGVLTQYPAGISAVLGQSHLSQKIPATTTRCVYLDHLPSVPSTEGEFTIANSCIQEGLAYILAPPPPPGCAR
jgi:hypothetical protein